MCMDSDKTPMWSLFIQRVQDSVGQTVNCWILNVGASWLWLKPEQNKDKSWLDSTLMGVAVNFHQLRTNKSERLRSYQLSSSFDLGFNVMCTLF